MVQYRFSRKAEITKSSWKFENHVPKQLIWKSRTLLSAVSDPSDPRYGLSVRSSQKSIARTYERYYQLQKVSMYVIWVDCIHNSYLIQS